MTPATTAPTRRPLRAPEAPERIERDWIPAEDPLAWRPRWRVAPIVFVGGTGRSGTHVVATLLGQHARFRTIPVECRFHVEDRGFPGLLGGEVSRRQFERRLRGFWWKGFQTNRWRGLYRFVPEERFEAAVEAFGRRYEEDAATASRRLLLDLLWPATLERGARGFVEQSCDTIARAGLLARLYPEAKFVHVIRDGRDASASRAEQTRGLVYPRGRKQALDWWAARLREADAGARALPPERILELSLDELVGADSEEAVARLADFVGLRPGGRMQRFFRRKMSIDLANVGRWREGLSERRAAEFDARYERVLEALDTDGVTSAPLLRATYERRSEP